jgi:putative endonuclease
VSGQRPRTQARQQFGRWGEDAAARYLAANGYALIQRNLRTPRGEIDILASKDGLLVFVEVKARSSHTFAYPEDSVTPRKQAHMLAAAEHYLQEHPESGESWQFDVIAVERGPDREPLITHFENVIG